MSYNILDADLSAYTVLVADDISLNLTMVSKMLDLYNFRIITASNGQEALYRMEEFKPALILVDLMMPVMDGFEVISSVRSNPDYASVRIVVMSALNSKASIVKALNLGADEFLTKPLTMDSFYDCISKQFELILAQEADSKIG